jgi:hypothetical protein
MQIGGKVMYLAPPIPKLNPQVFKTVKDPGIKERRRFATNIRIAVRVKKRNILYTREEHKPALGMKSKPCFY